jgi:hypothetical protein
MALGNNATVVNYLQILNGKFALKVDAPTRTSVSRMNKNNQIVHEELYGQCGGFLTNVTFHDGSYGTELHIEISERGEKYLIQTLATSNYAEDFLSRLLNVKLNEVIELHVFEKKEEKDGVTYLNGVLFIKDQNNQNIQKYFTAQNRRNLPEWEKNVNDEGKATFDKTKRIEFYKNMVKQFVFPAPTQQATQTTTAPKANTMPAPAFVQGSTSSDDLPF